MKSKIVLIMASIMIMSSAIGISFIGFVTAQSQDLVPYEKDLVPYTENYNVRFDSDGNIDYDLLIAEIMPEIFAKKLHVLGANVNSQDIVLERGPRILIYQPQSYNCGYVIDKEANKVYWLEAAINSTHIEYADIYPEIPRQTLEMDYMDCFWPLAIDVAETFLKEKSYFTPGEESVVAAAVKHELRGNENLNKYQFKIGKFNFNYTNASLSFCGKFEGRLAGTSYFSGVIKKSGQLYFGLESSMSSLCAIKENAKLYDVKFKNLNLDDSLQRWKNFRLADVYLSPESAENLLERNYLHVDFIPSISIGYASYLELARVNYDPENSSTVLRFVPSDKESYMKIRLPDGTSNYYATYGPPSWNAGKLLGISILVDDKHADYAQSKYVESPDAPYPQYYTDLVFRMPVNSTSVNVILDIENYDLQSRNGQWQDYVVRK